MSSTRLLPEARVPEPRSSFLFSRYVHSASARRPRRSAGTSSFSFGFSIQRRSASAAADLIERRTSPVRAQ
jgi:hypothetical protein